MHVGGDVTVGGGSSFISTGDITGVNIHSSSSLGQGISFNANGGNFLTQSTNTAIWLNYGPQGGPGGWSTLKWDFATYDGGSSRTEMSLTRGQLSVTGALTTSGLTNTGTTTLATNAGVLHSSSSGVVSSSKIINADVDSAAAIDGTKVVAASALVGGVLTTGAQNISGDKTFLNDVIVSTGGAGANMALTSRGGYFGGGSPILGESQVSISFMQSSSTGYICAWGSAGQGFPKFEFQLYDSGQAKFIPLILTTNSASIAGNFACNGVTPVENPTVNAACTDLASVIALVNQLRTALINTGIVK
jgi:hypothetical protein